DDEVFHALSLDHGVIAHVEGVALDGDVLVDGIVGRGQAAAVGDGVDIDGGLVIPVGKLSLHRQILPY
ncbi:MAG: hypothetical protein II367_06725, partial [Treponema sp.]|nr:hypothetical protein [Treponema sp.]